MPPNKRTFASMIFVIVVAILATGFAPGDTTNPTNPTGYDVNAWPEVRRYPAVMVQIVDADTFDIMVDLGWRNFTHERVRLDIVDAWEERGSEKEKGLKATKFVEDMAPPGSHIVVITNHKTDTAGVVVPHEGKYGRTLVRVLVGGLDLGTELLENGHAEYY